MNLNKIAIDPYLLAGLYRQPIIPENISPIPKKIPLKYLGENRKHILIIVQNKTQAFLDETSRELLTTILQACQLNVTEDIAVLNIAHYPEINWETIMENFIPAVIIYFGVNNDIIKPPINNYEITDYLSVKCLSAPALPELENNKTLKIHLWKSLQQLFHL